MTFIALANALLLLPTGYFMRIVAATAVCMCLEYALNVLRL